MANIIDYSNQKLVTLEHFNNYELYLAIEFFQTIKYNTYCLTLYTKYIFINETIFTFTDLI